MTNQGRKISWFKFDTVSDDEIIKMMSKPRFSFFFKKMDELAKIDGFPLIWLITSIDKAAASNRPRTELKPGNHYDSNAVDIVPLTLNSKGKPIIWLPIPQNRNFPMMSLFREAFIHNDPMTYPVIMFEADHIHVDVNHIGDVFFLNQVRRRLDQMIYDILRKPSNALLNRAINDKSYRSLNGLTNPIVLKK